MSPHPWLHRGARNIERDQRIARRLPMPLIEYPFEMILGVWGFLSGIQVVVSLTRPSTSSLPAPLPIIWGMLLLLGSIYTLWGLRRHAYATWLASGMTLFGWTCTIYSVAITVYATDLRRAVLSATLLFSIAAICFARGWFLRAREAILIDLGNGAAARE